MDFNQQIAIAVFLLLLQSGIQVFVLLVVKKNARWRDTKDEEDKRQNLRIADIERESKERDDKLNLELTRILGDFRSDMANTKEDLIDQIHRVQTEYQRSLFETRETILKAVNAAQVNLAEKYATKAEVSDSMGKFVQAVAKKD